MTEITRTTGGAVDGARVVPVYGIEENDDVAEEHSDQPGVLGKHDEHREERVRERRPQCRRRFRAQRSRTGSGCRNDAEPVVAHTGGVVQGSCHSFPSARVAQVSARTRASYR